MFDDFIDFFADLFTDGPVDSISETIGLDDISIDGNISESIYDSHHIINESKDEFLRFEDSDQPSMYESVSDGVSFKGNDVAHLENELKHEQQQLERELKEVKHHNNLAQHAIKEGRDLSADSEARSAEIHAKNAQKCEERINNLEKKIKQAIRSNNKN